MISCWLWELMWLIGLWLVDSSLMWNGPDSSPKSEYDDVDFKTEHDLRREMLLASDPVCQLELQKYFRNQVRVTLLSLRTEQFSYCFRKLILFIWKDLITWAQLFHQGSGRVFYTCESQVVLFKYSRFHFGTGLSAELKNPKIRGIDDWGPFTAPKIT